MGDRILVGDTATPTLVVSAQSQKCSVFALPAGGVVSLDNGDTFTLTAPAAFKPTCTPITRPAIIANGGGGISIDEEADPTNSLIDLPTQDPFYASTFPQCYALAATTVVAYTLVIMLFITPRSFLQGGVVVLGRRGFTNGGTGGTNIGGRPWLQKVAALTVAISLTIATADTFRVAEDQYAKGVPNAQNLQSEVLGGTELKVIRIISDTFLWLAQAQTLIRLFPRQREKIIIKYTAFALITLDLIFQCLNSFQYTNQGNIRPRSFTDAVPALSYLFQLSLGVLYAAWVIYYSLMKKRYAFYHPQMKNMILVSILSLLALLVPVVFFILDISKPDFTGWGDYVRWVGAAAASVIVWEWVERIEALEREEKKDGILGREIFDGDEMLEITQTDGTWPRKRKKRSKGSSSGDDGEGGGAPGAEATASGRGNVWPAVSSLATRYRSRSRSRAADEPGEPRTTESTNRDRIRFLQPPLWPARPQPVLTPVSRTDTASAASTVYAVRYHTLTETTSRSTPPPQGQRPTSQISSSASTHPGDNHNAEAADPSAPTSAPAPVPANHAPTQDHSGSRWRALAQGIPFPRLGRSNAVEESRTYSEDHVQHSEGSLWDIRGRLEEFAATQVEKMREKIRPTVDTANLPVVIVPAPQRAGEAMAQLRGEEAAAGLESRQTVTQTLDPLRPSSRAFRSNSSASRVYPSAENGALPTYLRRAETTTGVSRVHPPDSTTISATPGPVQAPTPIPTAPTRVPSQTAPGRRPEDDEFHG